MKPIILAFGAVAVAPATVALSTHLGQAGPISLPYTDAGVVAQGRELYGQHCSSCHGARLEGQPNWREPGDDGLMPAPPHDESGHTWHHSDALLFAITKHGTEAVVGGQYRSNMRGFGDTLSDAEIVAVLAWIKSTWPPRIIAIHDRINDDAAGQSR
jgi:mono/diheme cytochrome c family protein